MSDDLIKRLENAHGPDRELDADIAALCHPTDDPTNEAMANGRDYPDLYTASIDAAITLRPDGCDLEIYFDDPAHRRGDTWLTWVVQVGTPDGRFIIGKSDYPGVAISTACLKARAAIAAKQDS